MRKHFTATIAIGLLGAALASPLVAQDGTMRVYRSIEIELSDLDLSDRQDMEALRDRIDTAVRKVCPARFEGPVKKYPDPRGCRKQARNAVEIQLASITARRTLGETGPNRLAITAVPDTRD